MSLAPAARVYFALLVLVPLLPLLVAAAPSPVNKRQDTITALSAEEVAAFRPYSYYANTGYCKPNLTIDWSCGANCDANPDFIPVAAGGDGGWVQYCKYLASFP